MPADPVYVQLLDELLDLHYTKSGGYGTGSDPLANFTAIAEASGEPAWLYPQRRSLEKHTRMESLYRQGRVDELSEERLDIASLMLCAEALWRRSAAVSTEEPPGGPSPPRSGDSSRRTSSVEELPLIGLTTLVGSAEPSSLPSSSEAFRGLPPRDSTPRVSPRHPEEGSAVLDPTTARAQALFSARLRELADLVDVVGLSSAAEAFDIDRPIAERELSAALRVSADLIGPERSEGSYVAPCARGDDRAESRVESAPVLHTAHTPCKSLVFRSDRAAGEELRSRIEERAGQDTTGVGRHTPSPDATPARLRDAQRGDDGWVRVS